MLSKRSFKRTSDIRVIEQKGKTSRRLQRGWIGIRRSGGLGVDDCLYAFENVIASLGTRCADIELEIGFFGNDVFSIAGMEGRYCYDSKVERIDFTGYNRLETGNRGSRLNDWIDASMRCRCVGLPAFDVESVYY
jgi:hypothetical protein